MTRGKTGRTDDDAALSAWEQTEGNTPHAPPHPKLAGIKSAFAAHAEVCALTRTLDTAMQDTGGPVSVTVEVQPGLLALLLHMERIDATRAGRTPAPPERILAQLASNHLENLLHGLVVDPTSHPHFAEIWNGLCAAANAPELAVPDGNTAAADTPPATRGPF